MGRHVVNIAGTPPSEPAWWTAVCSCGARSGTSRSRVDAAQWRADHEREHPERITASVDDVVETVKTLRDDDRETAVVRDMKRAVLNGDRYIVVRDPLVPGSTVWLVVDLQADFGPAAVALAGTGEQAWKIIDGFDAAETANQASETTVSDDEGAGT